ncbi:MAG TPA: CopG family ribbon-helix-helix protein [Candidatus Thermoplasmatota archaeon]|nr:CopG family ribbon-helix-helix protein [Candidatus Thermoplasmatota archaeon]
MAVVISASFPPELVADMDAAIASGAYRGRSEFLRAAVRDHLIGTPTPGGRHVHGSITLLYPHEKEARVSDVRHAFHDVVLSLMHTHCEQDTCMDVLIVGGPPARVVALQETLERMRDVHRSRLVLMA